MSRILLARHGHHDEVGRVLSGRSDIALSARGLDEARGMTRLMGPGSPQGALDAIWSSPRRRALETAGVVATATGLAVGIAPGLDEVDFGAFAGRSFASLDADPDWHRWNAERAQFRAPGGETMAEAAARAWAFLRQLGDAGGTVLCVSHCDVIRALVADVLGLAYDRMFAFDCDPGSITALELGDAGARLVALNLVGG